MNKFLDRISLNSKKCNLNYSLNICITLDFSHINSYYKGHCRTHDILDGCVGCMFSLNNNTQNSN